MKVVFCSSEATPFVKTGGLGDVAGTLPLALEKLGMEVFLFLPKYKTLDLTKFTVQKVSPKYSLVDAGHNLKTFFVEHEGYFGRDGLYGTPHGDYEDNLERFQFFSLKIFEILKEINCKPDILHCHDWQTALIPVYLKERFKKDSFFTKTKSVLTIHNLAYQGVFSRQEFPKLGLPDHLFGLEGFEFYGKGNLLKAGIIFADEITTVSPKYAKEILTREFGCGLEGVLKQHKNQLKGILNGIDYSFWNPRTDKFIEKNYAPDNFVEGKKANKIRLQQDFKLPESSLIPMFGFVGRLSHQKGIDLIVEAMRELAKSDIQVVFLGEGESKYAALLKDLQRQFPNKIGYQTKFDERMAHQIYAGSDMFLMPSCYEPCGLSQMISLAYGTVPIVYQTGGLADTIIPHDAINLLGDGFVFKEYKVKEFIHTIKQALEIYRTPKFAQLMRNGYIANFSWERSALEYKELYQCLLSQ